MATRLERQTSWAAGELSPAAQGQVDAPHYKKGAAKLENFLVARNGALLNRAGTQYIYVRPTDTPGTAAAMPRVFPWIVDGQTTKLIVIGDLAPDGEGVYVFQPTAGGEKTLQSDRNPTFTQIKSITMPSDMNDIRLFQQGKAAFLSGLDANVYLLVDNDDGTWRLVTFLGISLTPWYTLLNHESKSWMGLVLYDGESALGTSTDATNHPTARWQYAIGYTVELSTGDIVRLAPARIDDLALDLATLIGSPWETTLEDAQATSLLINNHIEYPTGTFVNTRVTVPAKIAVWEGQPRTLFVGVNINETRTVEEIDRAGNLALYFGVASTDSAKVISVQVYRGRDGRFGYIGEVTSGCLFTDKGDLPDFSMPAPSGRYANTSTGTLKMNNHFGRSPVYQKKARITAHVGNRVIVGGSINYSGVEVQPGRLWFSEARYAFSFLEPDGPEFNESSPFHLDIGIGEKLHHGLPFHKGLLVLGGANVYFVHGGDLGALATDTARVERLAGVGAHPDVSPVTARGDIFFVGIDQQTVYVARRGQAGLGVQSVDALSDHLFDGKTIVRLAYAETPYNILWALLSDGTLAALTWSPETETVAWSHHTVAPTSAAITKVQDIAAIPSAGEHTLYMVIQRGYDWYLERMAFRRVSNLRECFFLDQAITWQAPAVAGETVTIVNKTSSDTGAVDDDVTCTFQGGTKTGVGVFALLNPNDPTEEPVYIFMNSGWDTTGTHDGIVANRPLPAWAYTATLQYYRPVFSIDLPASSPGVVRKVLLDGDLAGDIPADHATGVWGFEDERPWGAISVCIGIPYNSDLEMLPSPELEGGQKVLRRCLIRAAYTRGGYVGADYDRLEELDPRPVDLGYAQKSLGTVVADRSVAAPLGTDGAMVLRQSEPYPITVTRVTREIDHRGR